jgi:hypothetical protein
VTSSEGKIEVVRPSSAPMFAIVARWGTVSVATPGPEYSKILPKPPRTVRRRSNSRMTSFAATQGRSRPVSTTRTMRGNGK